MKQDVRAYAEVMHSFLTLRNRKETEMLLNAFLEYLKAQKRTPMLTKILRAYEDLLESRDEGGRVVVITRYKLSTTMRDAVLRLFGLPRTVEIEERIDPTILGGFIARYGGHYIDLSLKKKLNDMRRVLKRT